MPGRRSSSTTASWPSGTIKSPGRSEPRTLRMGMKLLCVVAHPDDECFRLWRRPRPRRRCRRRSSRPLLHRRPGRLQPRRSKIPRRTRPHAPRRVCRLLRRPRRHPAHQFLDYQDGQLEHANFSDSRRPPCRSSSAPFRPDVSPHLRPRRHPQHAPRPHHGLGLHLRRLPLGLLRQTLPAGSATPSTMRSAFSSSPPAFFMPDRPAPHAHPVDRRARRPHVLARKQEAFRRHTSQAPLMEKTRTLFEQFGHTEHYTLLAQCDPGPARQRTSLFEDLTPR